MSAMKRLLYITLMCSFASALFAQPISEIPLRFKLQAADSAYTLRDFYNAADWYEQAYNEVRSLDLAYKVGECYYELKDIRRAERWLSRAVSRDSVVYPRYHFILGRTYKMNGNYEEAQEIFESLLSNPDAMDYAALVQSELDGIKFALTSAKRGDLEITSLGNRVNTRNQESSPVMDEEGNFYFVTFNTSDLVEAPEGKPAVFASIFQSKKDDRGRWSAPKELEELKRPAYHNSHVTISPNGERLYFTRAQVENGDVVNSDLYYSEKRGRSWGAPIAITSLNGDFLNTNPTVGYLFGQEVLIYASDRNGGFGGMDLYYSYVQADGSFGLGTNLGEIINTPADEITPFMDELVLYFSSDGHPNLGGFDIFQSEWNGENWGPVENLGKGLNTSLDDLYFTLQG